jgi:hypothetical protein
MTPQPTQPVWMENVIVGALRSTYDAHGPIDPARFGSAAKRIASAITKQDRPTTQPGQEGQERVWMIYVCEDCRYRALDPPTFGRSYPGGCHTVKHEVEAIPVIPRPDREAPEPRIAAAEARVHELEQALAPFLNRWDCDCDTCERVRLALTPQQDTDEG